MKNIFSKPNQVTMIRILLIPVFIYFLLSELPYKEFIAAFIFTILSLSDAVDGYLARKRKEITEFGKLIDPIADKLLISAALVFLIGNGVPAWMAILIILREPIITGLRIIFVTEGKVISAGMLGKLKTVLQIVGILMVILKFPLAWHFMLLAVFITIISGVDYLIRFSNVIHDKALNIPNLITMIRLLLIPFYVLSLFYGMINMAILLLIIIAVGDKLDGLSARLMKQKTNFGKNFDSFTDWIFALSTIVIFAHIQIISGLFAFFLIIPMILIGAVKATYMKKFKKAPKSRVSKPAVGVGYATFFVLLVDYTYKDYFLFAVLILLWVALVDFIYQYLSQSKQFLYPQRRNHKYAKQKKNKRI